MKGPLRERPRRDILGLDFGASGLKAVRLTSARGQLSLAAADILPPVNLSAPGDRPRLELPPPLLTNYAAVCLGGARAAVRLLDLPAAGGKVEEQIQQQFNLAGDFRLGHCPVTPPEMKGTIRTVAAALPEDEAQAVLQRLTVGPPAPASLELSSLAALGAFQAGPGDGVQEDAVGLIDTGVSASHLFILRLGRPVLIRRIEPGGAAVIERIREQFDLDAAMAENVLRTGAIDLSAVYRETLAAFFKQLTMSREFVERREHCRIIRWYLTGGLCVNAFWPQTLAEVTGLPASVWDPLQGISVAAEAIPDRIRNQTCRLSAAIGAALGAILPT